MLKTVELAPIPSASVSTATAVKPGFFASMRKPYFRSCISIRIDFFPGDESNQKPANVNHPTVGICFLRSIQASAVRMRGLTSMRRGSIL